MGTLKVLTLGYAFVGSAVFLCGLIEDPRRAEDPVWIRRLAFMLVAWLPALLYYLCRGAYRLCLPKVSCGRCSGAGGYRIGPRAEDHRECPDCLGAGELEQWR